NGRCRDSFPGVDQVASRYDCSLRPGSFETGAPDCRRIKKAGIRRVEYRLMKKILIIGIGAGDPEYITMQAVNALNEADVFFIMDKGPGKAKLIELRKEICRRYIRGDDHRFVDAT